jgi:hypothetical protein
MLTNKKVCQHKSDVSVCKFDNKTLPIPKPSTKIFERNWMDLNHIKLTTKFHPEIKKKLVSKISLIRHKINIGATNLEYCV